MRTPRSGSRTEGIRQYQPADLILLNGADYEKWRLTSVLPLASRWSPPPSFADRYMTNGEVITHSHGRRACTATA